MALTYDCYVRIYVKCDENGNIIEDYNDTSDDLHGHFDLQINKPSGDTLKLPHKKTVYSYGPRKNKKGTLKIFNDDFTDNVMTDFPYRLFYWKFEASEAQVQNFKTKLKGCINNTVHSEDFFNWYDVTSAMFDDYDMTRSNCFSACAYFTSWLGNNRLMSIYNDYKDWEDGYKNYFAWRMWLKYHQYWTGGKLHVEG